MPSQKIQKIDPDNLPAHVAVIMDGNGRWAQKKGMARIFGHQHAIKAVRETVEGAAELGVRYLTLYAFSTENWSRPKKEVDALMELLVSSINNELDTLLKNSIRLQAIGDLESLPSKCHRELDQAIERTAHGTRMTLIVALSYSSKWEITRALRTIADSVKKGILDPESITEKTVAAHLCTAGIPDPELLIRTSGEHRISNFLLWQIAYAELYFTPVLWPDFRKQHLHEAIIDYQRRERRFGLTGEQVKPSKSRLAH